MEAMKKTTSITVQDVPVTIMNVDQRDYISLTDMARARTDAGRAADVIKNWLRQIHAGIPRNVGSHVQPEFQSGRIRPL